MEKKLTKPTPKKQKKPTPKKQKIPTPKKQKKPTPKKQKKHKKVLRPLKKKSLGGKKLRKKHHIFQKNAGGNPINPMVLKKRFLRKI